MSVIGEKKKKSIKLDELNKLKKEHKEIEEQSEKLNDYLNQNIFSVFDKSQQSTDSNLEEILDVSDNSFNFFKKLSKSGVFEYNFPALEINNLTKYYGNKNIATLVNVSLKVFFGDFHIVVGAYSSGKTTLFNCIAGKEEYEGEILFNSQNYKGDILKINKVCGFVSYEHEFDLFSTMEEVIHTKLQLMGVEESTIRNYMSLKLKAFGLEEKRKSFIIDLTLLEIRKVQLLIALIFDPNILALDQSLLGLQDTEKIELLDLLIKYKDSERSVILFSHDLTDLPSYFNSCTLLIEGRTYYSGSMENLLLESKNRYIISTSDNESCLKLLPKYVTTHSVNLLKNVIFCTFDGKMNLLLFQRECLEKNIILLEIKKVSLELEDIYNSISKIGSKTARIELNRKKFFST
ncbi:ABC transporter-like ATP-binding protein [Mycoplasma wenyonii str. Massachusetts]|uniref:ABC transporter-like ATP-binding protein n=1 Tax=Mycoplasma wenyonii (strain Massachusetts) TaxID=1197325 RepID=I6ZI31_MYCWM|nr:ATP-binding cassette domain-containing protein [Mycoplasma wenyonii]AFN64815.1 ABC transporter-like ATP-binding protein [Mycoplasma wenyonii str. Massachusetts]